MQNLTFEQRVLMKIQVVWDITLCRLAYG